jgi:hypothetical protein
MRHDDLNRGTGDAWDARHAELMQKIEDLPVREAIDSGIAVKCPTCGLIHPGDYFGHPDHKSFCSSECFKGRQKR